MLAAIPTALDGAPLTREALAARGGGARGGRGARREARRRLRRPAQARGVHRRPLLRAVPTAGSSASRRRAAGWTASRRPARTRRRRPRSCATYLAAYGPAPREQFQRWFGMTSPAEAGRWIRGARRRGRRGRRGGRAGLDARRRRRGAAAARRARGRRAARCRGSTSTWSAHRAASRRCSPTSTGPRSTARRAGSRRSCWTTGAWRARGSYDAQGRIADRHGDARSRGARRRAAGGRRGGGAAPRGLPRRLARPRSGADRSRTSVRATQPSGGSGR